MVPFMVLVTVGAAAWAVQNMYRQGFKLNFGGPQGVTFSAPPADTGTGSTTIFQHYYQQTGENNQQHVLVKQDGAPMIDAVPTGESV